MLDYRHCSYLKGIFIIFLHEYAQKNENAARRRVFSCTDNAESTIFAVYATNRTTDGNHRNFACSLVRHQILCIPYLQCVSLHLPPNFCVFCGVCVRYILSCEASLHFPEEPYFRAGNVDDTWLIPMSRKS